MTTKLNVQQLEISITVPLRQRRRPPSVCRPARARWWFEQMRRVVDEAADRKPLAACSEQIGLPLLRGLPSGT